MKRIDCRFQIGIPKLANITSRSSYNKTFLTVKGIERITVLIKSNVLLSFGDKRGEVVHRLDVVTDGRNKQICFNRLSRLRAATHTRTGRTTDDIAFR